MLCEACHKQKKINQKATAAVLMVIICTEIKWLCDDDYQRFSGMYHSFGSKEQCKTDDLRSLITVTSNISD